jgi:formylglycine-generating enzyme required for sulfatase activity
MARIEKTVFISYRRKDISWALAVYQYLTSQKYDVFFDFSSLSSGDFEQVIISNIRARAHFLLILTPTALDRCDEPGDWLRREIETAVDEKRNIIPLFLDGFNFASPNVVEKLTGKLVDIKRYNGLDIPAGYFIEAMDRLRERYLNVPLNAVIHPVSTEVRKVVRNEQSAVNAALAEKWKDLKALIQPTREKESLPGTHPVKESNRTILDSRGKSFNLRFYGIGVGVLLVVMLGIAGINAWMNGANIPKPTFTSQPANTITIAPSFTVQPNTETVQPPTATVTPTPTKRATFTITASPTLGVLSTQISPKDGMVLMYVPAGEFRMGAQGGEIDELPVHTVYLDAFWIDQTEVTNAMYAKCISAGRCDPPQPSSSFDTYGDPQFDNYPVTSVNWENAASYCTWSGRRLPTEAEWEKAARGVEQRVYPWGKQIDCSFANYYDGKRYCFSRQGGPSPVKYSEIGRSPYGLYDMAGNVWEWVNDWYASNYYQRSPSRNPGGATSGQARVVRGGSWVNDADNVRAANRVRLDPSDANNTLGFRCALSP